MAKKFRIRLLVPYVGLMESILSISPDYPLLDLQVSVSTLDDAVRLGIDAEQEGFDLIVSRGDTMLMIRKAVSIPVFGIEITGDDLLRVISLAEAYSGKWAFLGFPLIMNQAKSLCSTLRNNAQIYTITSSSECESKIQSLRQEGYSLIVGDAVTVSLAAKYGLNTILIASTEEAVRKTLDHITYVCRYTETYRNTIRLYQQVMSNSPRHTLVFDRSKNLVLYSGLRAIELSNQLLGYLDTAFQTPLTQTLITSGNELWKIESRHLDDPNTERASYVAFFCNQLSNSGLLQSLSQKDSIRFFDPTNEQTVNFDSFLRNSPKMDMAIRAAKKYSSTQAPLLFIGEEGVETDVFIHAVYQSSAYADNTLLWVDCSALNTSEWEELLSGEDPLLYRLLKNSSYTLYLKYVDQMPRNMQSLLFRVYSETQQFQSLRLLLSTTQNMQTSIEHGQFLNKLYFAISPLEIQIPPLRERQEDFVDLCSLAIGEYNIRYGKAIAGIENSALEQLKLYHWPGNLPQFNNTISLLIKNTKNDYITLSDVESILAHYPCPPESKSGFYLDLNSTLEEMESSIIKYVFECEGENSSKAASRLGIGRSTLWRKLKNSNCIK